MSTDIVLKLVSVFRFFCSSLSFVFGLVILIIGALMKSNVSSIGHGTKTVLNTLKDGDFDLAVQANELSNLFIVIGVFSLLTSLLGSFGFTVVFVGIVMKIVGFILIVKFEVKIEEKLKIHLAESLHKNFVQDSINGGNYISDGWNRMFLSLDCCAVNSVDSTTNDFDNTPWCTTSGECQLTNAEIPKTCCVGVTTMNYTSAPLSCFYSMNPGSYNTKGCFQALKDLLEENIISQSATILGVGITLLIFEVLSVISAISIYRL